MIRISAIGNKDLGSNKHSFAKFYEHVDKNEVFQKLVDCGETMKHIIYNTVKIEDKKNKRLKMSEIVNKFNRLPKKWYLI